MKVERRFSVYAHINKINGLVYIGKAENIKTRWNPESYTGSPRFYEAIQEFGWDNFDHIILYSGLTQDEAYGYERDYIEKYDTTNPMNGYNTNRGRLYIPEEFPDEDSYKAFMESAKNNPYIEINASLMSDLHRILSTRACSVFMKLLQLIRPADGVLYKDKYLTIKDSAELLYEEYGGFRKAILELEKALCLARVKIKVDHKPKTIIVINPYIIKCPQSTYFKYFITDEMINTKELDYLIKKYKGTDNNEK